MRIDEVVLDRERLFKMKQQYDLRQKAEKLDTAIQQAKDTQAKLESWMNSRLDFIEHLPDKMFQLELQPVTRNFMGGVSPIEVLYWALTDQGKDTFTEKQYELAKQVALKHKDKIVQMLDKQLSELNNLAKQADEQEWPENWRESVRRFDSIKRTIEELLDFFSDTNF